MKIISKEKDYYDGLMDHSSDRLNKVWVRNSEKVYLPIFRLKEFDLKYFYWGNEINLYFLIVTGRVYSVLSLHNFAKNDPKTGKYIPAYKSYYYTLEDFDKEHPEISRSMYNKRAVKVGYDKGRIKDHWIDFFKPLSLDFTDLCIELNSPIILIRKDKDKFLCETNVNLGEIGFSKVMNSFAIYQELDMFISNQLVNDNMPMTQMTDADKIQAHGFDKVTSFRKGK